MCEDCMMVIVPADDDASTKPPPGSKECRNNHSVPDQSEHTRKSSLRRRAPKQAHAPLSRKISFPPEELFQSSVSDADNLELHRVLRLHATALDLDKANHSGVTALHQAVLNKNLDAVKLLLLYGCRVDVADAHGFTALHTASACGHMSIASLLILHGAHVFATTNTGDIPADLAKDSSMARMLQEEMVHQLHGQQQQQQQGPSSVSILHVILGWIVALCVWIWKCLSQCFVTKKKKRS